MVHKTEGHTTESASALFARHGKAGRSELEQIVRRACGIHARGHQVDFITRAVVDELERRAVVIVHDNRQPPSYGLKG